MFAKYESVQCLPNTNRTKKLTGLVDIVSVIMEKYTYM